MSPEEKQIHADLKLRANDEPEVAPEKDSVIFGHVCVYDARFDAAQFEWRNRSLLKVAALLKGAKGRVIQDVVYEEEPLSDTNRGNIGAFKIILRP